MLLSLSIKNLAIIDNIQIDFKNGMTALTGETGSGKSLIIDAIGLLFGDRASSDLVRNGENKAFIEGVFDKYNSEVNNMLKELEIDIDDILIIKREIYANGKSICKINGEVVNANTLNNISNYLGDIHTQFDSIKLVNPKNYFTFIDDNSINELLISYKESLTNYNKLKKEYELKVKNKEETLKKLDFLKYQLNELEKANLKKEELENLNEQYDVLNNHGKIFECYQEFIKTIEDNDLLTNLFNSYNILSKNIRFNKDLENDVNRLKDSYYDLQDIYENVKHIISHDDFDINELDNINFRLDLYKSLMKKYNMNVDELINYRDKIKKDIEEISDFDYFIEEIKKQVEDFYNKTLQIGKNISKLRKENADKLSIKLLENLNDLELKNVSLYIDIKETSEFNVNGINTIDFLVSFNKGESLKSLSKTASGGELSRFMLALKAINSDKDYQKTFIFDEIDTGVSGEIAQKIGERIKKISINNQVICVTHLPQVAAICDNHLFISKTNDNERMKTEITELDYEGRVNAIALMLSKGQVTKATIELAKELLNE